MSCSLHAVAGLSAVSRGSASSPPLALPPSVFLLNHRVELRSHWQTALLLWSAFLLLLCLFRWQRCWGFAVLLQKLLSSGHSSARCADTLGYAWCSACACAPILRPATTPRRHAPAGSARQRTHHMRARAHTLTDTPRAHTAGRLAVPLVTTSVTTSVTTCCNHICNHGRPSRSRSPKARIFDEAESGVERAAASGVLPLRHSPYAVRAGRVRGAQQRASAHPLGGPLSSSESDSMAGGRPLGADSYASRSRVYL